MGKRYWSTGAVLISVLVFFIQGMENTEAGPSSLEGEVQVNDEWTIVPIEGEETQLTVTGSFIITAKSGPNMILQTTATLSLSEGQWEAALKQTEYPNVAQGEIYPLAVDVTIPDDADIGESATYAVTLTLEDQITTYTTQAGFLVKLISGSVDDDPGVDTDNETPDPSGQGGGSSGNVIIPIFILGVIFLLVFAGIWAYRNIEVVREVDGKRKLYLREKDSGRIIGKDR